MQTHSYKFNGVYEHNKLDLWAINVVVTENAYMCTVYLYDFSSAAKQWGIFQNIPSKICVSKNEL